jgi:prepilin-type N-terminal cleavage/methylation domain-containing protein
MKTSSCFPLRRSPGFTLVEILVALSILTVVMVMISQAVGIVSQTWRKGMARVDNFSQARAVLNLANRDIQSIVLRPDLAAFVDAAGKPSFTFYSQVNGSSGTRKLSLIRYSLNSANPPVFERNDLGFSYPATTGGLSLGITDKLPDLALMNPTNAQPLSEGILIFQWQALDDAGKLSPTFDQTTTKAIVISILVLDTEAFRLAQKLNKVDEIRDLFETTTLPADKTYSQYWLGILNTTGFGASLPPQLRTGIRSFERYIPLPSSIGSAASN